MLEPRWLRKACAALFHGCMMPLRRKPNTNDLASRRLCALQGLCSKPLNVWCLSHSINALWELPATGQSMGHMLLLLQAIMHTDLASRPIGTCENMISPVKSSQETIRLETKTPQVKLTVLNLRARSTWGMAAV